MSNTTQLYANKKDLWIKIKHLPSGNSVKFKAMLKSFSDNFESNWNSEEVYGRMDPIETFQGTKRIIQIEWDVVAYDLYEAEDNLYNADRLSTFLYPVYSDLGNSNSITTAPLLRMKFSNLISSVNSEGLLGRLAGFQYTPDLDSGVFFNRNNLMCPQAITINATFHVLHEHSLGWDSDGKRRESRLPHGAKKPRKPRRPAPTLAEGAGDVTSDAFVIDPIDPKTAGLAIPGERRLTLGAKAAAAGPAVLADVEKILSAQLTLTGKKVP